MGNKTSSRIRVGFHRIGVVTSLAASVPLVIYAMNGSGGGGTQLTPGKILSLRDLAELTPPSTAPSHDIWVMALLAMLPVVAYAVFWVIGWILSGFTD